MDSGKETAGTQWWSRLEPATRAWLVSNNGDAVPDGIAAEVLAAGGPAAQPAGGGSGLYYPDEVIDWIEETANGEGASGFT
ncbi:hypothetical protein H9639_02950 [Arthrobacter sp. Sa2CUA1]|uniref:Uncharacterized protein n=1 Tax=Arthrobacter gallicola TaxID=2762225 RepID=A0ABR8UNW1_9MICC|nr:hypothetical protein [Arthrobacter gallicola]MBD7994253.1 hypothetical protein [Arthrobacter gallicola]